jgi:hypothetical protein
MPGTLPVRQARRTGAVRGFVPEDKLKKARRLRDHGFRLFTLTDDTLAISGRQLSTQT